MPLLVLRGDGGAMALDAFRARAVDDDRLGPGGRRRRRAAPARADRRASCSSAAARARTSRVVKGGRTVLRDAARHGPPDVDPLGRLAGSSAPPAARWRGSGRRRIDEVGPRSAHVAGLPYACFADAGASSPARALELIAPRAGDPEAYAVVRAPRRARCALTATCAAQRARPRRRRGALAARLARGGAGRLRGARPRGCAHARRRRRAAVLDGAVDKIAEAVAEAARAHDFGPDVPVVALGGAGHRARRREVARAARPAAAAPEHPEVLSSIGAALSLVRAEVVRHCVRRRRDALRSPARPSARASTPAPRRRRSRVETQLRAARRPAARGRDRRRRARVRRRRAASRVDEDGQRAAAAAATGAGDPAALRLVGATDYYRVFSDDGAGAVAVVDGLGAVPVCRARASASSAATDGDGLLDAAAPRGRRRARRTSASATLLPRVCVVAGAHVVDLSDSRAARRTSSPAPRAVLDGDDGTGRRRASGADAGDVALPRTGPGPAPAPRRIAAACGRRRRSSLVVASSSCSSAGDELAERAPSGRRPRAPRPPKALDGLELLRSSTRRRCATGASSSRPSTRRRRPTSQRARDALADVDRAADPGAHARARMALAGIETAVERRVAAAQLKALVAQARSALQPLAG